MMEAGGLGTSEKTVGRRGLGLSGGGDSEADLMLRIFATIWTSCSNRRGEGVLGMKGSGTVKADF